MDGLSNLAMKPKESMGELLARITNTMVIIKESYATYKNKVEAPHHDANGGYLDTTATKWKNDSVNNVMQFFKMQLFRAALLGTSARSLLSMTKILSPWMTCIRSQLPHKEKPDPSYQKPSLPWMRKATLTQRTKMTRLPPFRTGGTRDSQQNKEDEYDATSQ
jgi:hypothetical protein